MICARAGLGPAHNGHSISAGSSLLSFARPLLNSLLSRVSPPRPPLTGALSLGSRDCSRRASGALTCNLGSLETVAGKAPVFPLGQAPTNPSPRAEKGGSFDSQHLPSGSVRLSCQLGTPHGALDPGGASTVSSPERFGPRQLKIWFSGSWRPVGVPAPLHSTPRAGATLR